MRSKLSVPEDDSLREERLLQPPLQLDIEPGPHVTGALENVGCDRHDVLDSRAPSCGELIESLLQQALLVPFAIHTSLPLFLCERARLSPLDELLLPLSDGLETP